MGWVAFLACSWLILGCVLRIHSCNFSENKTRCLGLIPDQLHVRKFPICCTIIIAPNCTSLINIRIKQSGIFLAPYWGVGLGGGRFWALYPMLILGSVLRDRSILVVWCRVLKIESGLADEPCLLFYLSIFKVFLTLIFCQNFWISMSLHPLLQFLLLFGYYSYGFGFWGLTRLHLGVTP